ncbi:MAG TPA: hypothetical protein VJN21_00445 [Candidatus Acidoferrales bacterium]|nr:hypothetical protein [Candidatus Acidoferrales bacterium]
MKWRIFRSEVDPHEGFADQLAATREPYAAAWKEFDKLQKRAKQQRGWSWVHIIDNVLPLLAGGAYGLAAWKGHKAYVLAAALGLVVLAVLKGLSDRRRFADWPCPRCHSVWPGTKSEKDSKCKVCGLRLRQMAP